MDVEHVHMQCSDPNSSSSDVKIALSDQAITFSVVLLCSVKLIVQLSCG